MAPRETWHALGELGVPRHRPASDFLVSDLKSDTRKYVVSDFKSDTT